jgi:hypothetical protein
VTVTAVRNGLCGISDPILQNCDMARRRVTKTRHRTRQSRRKIRARNRKSFDFNVIDLANRNERRRGDESVKNSDR